MVTNPYPHVKRYKEEKSYYDPKTKTNVIFPQISDPPSVDLSVIVPAYNEELRCKFTTSSLFVDCSYETVYSSILPNYL